MFEIGAALRAARERQGLERADVERELHIRDSYLAALEDERFDRTPGRAYAKGFLRSYADFLGLDGQRFVAELNERFADDEPTALPTPAPVAARLPAPRRLVLAAGLLLACLVGLLVWRLAAGAPTRTVRHAPATSRVRAAAPPPASGPPPARPQTAHVVLRARGRCWLSVRVGSAAGPVLYEGTLAAGAALRYTLAPSRPRLWARVGAPWNLRLLLDGAPAAVPLAAPGNLVLLRHRLEAP